jgi:8-oxo-dGTP diphosphatase
MMRVNDSSPRHREVACAIIIDTCERFLLQQRDDIVGILLPGKVGLFGGHREKDETFLECVVREVHEELSYFIPAERFEYLTGITGEDIETEGGSIHGVYYVARDVPVEALVITEGSLLMVEPDDVIALNKELTPTARLALKAFGAIGLN